MRSRCILPVLLLPLAACEPMEDPGSPFAPVPVAGQAAPATVDPEAGEPEAAPEPDPMFDVPEPVVIHSSELGQRGTEPEPEAPAEPEPTVVEAEPGLAPEAFEVAAVPAPLAASPYVAAPASVGGWPLRLVATVPGAQPPRAILGLPGGEEIVVSPGTMLPDQGVVVMAVGAQTVDLAEVRPAGDHAVIQGRTLQSQRTQRLEISGQ